MIDRRTLLLAAGSTAALTACGDAPPRILPYNGPQVTGIVAWKERRQLVLLNGADVLKSYHFELGFTPTGAKRFEGDGRTPEGTYSINRKNPRSQYHLSVGVSYPNNEDRNYAYSQGRSPGGDIFIHGTPRRFRNTRDWTAGCLAVTNAEVEEIYSMVGVGTPIVLLP